MDLRDPETLASISSSIIRPSKPHPLNKLYRGEPMALGITQILIGVLEIAFGLVVVISKYDTVYDLEHHITIPYWLGILYIISGSLSVAVAKNLKTPLVKGMLGMNVVSSVAAGIGILFLSISLTFPPYHDTCDPHYYNSTILSELCREIDIIPEIQMFFMCAVLLVFTILEFLIAITTAAFGCASMCRNGYNETTVVIFQNTAQEASPAVLTPVKEDEAP